MAKTALIISTYNWAGALELCLKSVLCQQILPDEIIIADDGSGEETGKVVRRFSENTTITVKHVWQEDRGFRLARIRNMAVKSVESDYLIFIDGDIILHPEFIKDHIANRQINRFVTGSRVLLSEKETGERINNGDIKFAFPFYAAQNKINGIRSVFLSELFSGKDTGIFNLRGCNMAFWKNDLVAVNGFDEQYTGWGREDSDVVFRLLQTGKYRLKLKFGAVQYHLFHAENNRETLEKNNHILSATISEKRIFSKIGLTELS